MVPFITYYSVLRVIVCIILCLYMYVYMYSFINVTFLYAISHYLRTLVKPVSHDVICCCNMSSEYVHIGG